MFKDLLLTGLGATVVMRERVEEELTKLQEKGKIQTDDAKSFLSSLEKRGDEEQQRIKDELKSTLKEVLDELGVATKEDIEKLKKSLE